MVSLITVGFFGLLIIDVTLNQCTVEAGTIYVDSSGGGDYTTIQAAIDNATSGDTIIVANGTYYESVIINKTNINLIGNSTTDCKIIHYYVGTDVYGDYASAINVTASGASISGFNISVSGDYTFGVRMNSSSSLNSNISNNYITATGKYGYGIFLYQTSKNNLFNNTINTSGVYGHGMYFERSSNNNLTGNTINTKMYSMAGIWLYDSSNNNNLSGNRIYTTRSRGYGIYLYNSSNNDLLGNTINTTDTQGHGIYLNSNSNHNNLTGNNINISGQNAFGIFITSDSDNNTLLKNQINCSNDNEYGIDIYKSYNNRVTDVTINITGQNGYGIYLQAASGTNLTNITINMPIQSGQSIYLYSSWNINVTNNIINGSGISMYSSSNIHFINNTIIASEDGISLSYTKLITLSGNNMTNCSVNINGDLLEYWNTHTIDPTNTINSKPIYYYKNTTGETAPPNTSEVIIANCTYMNVSHQDFIEGGIFSAYSNHLVIENNTLGFQGIQIRYSNYTDIINNKNTIAGIQLYASENNNVAGNTINTSIDWMNGITLYDSPDNNITDNTLNTVGIGVLLNWGSDNNNITDNTIITKGTNGLGIHIFESSNNDVMDNTIKINDDYGYGIYLQQFSDNNNLTGNEIDVLGRYTPGILLYSTSNNNLTDNIINTSGPLGRGISLEYSTDSILLYNHIQTYDEEGDGIYLQYSSRNNITGNIINTYGLSAYGAWIYRYSNNNTLLNNHINTTRNFAAGICSYLASNDNIYEGNVIVTQGTGSPGIAINDSLNNLVINCNSTTLGPTAHGFYLDSHSVTIINSTLSTTASVGSYGIMPINNGEITAINCSFNTVQLLNTNGGMLKVKNYLAIQAFDEDGATSLENADIEVKDNGIRIYASLGYGGTQQKTDTNGKVENILVTDRWYSYSNTEAENATTVSVKKIEGLNWEEVRPEVDMSTSHTEIFILYANYLPSIPTGLEINRVAGINSLNISWDHNPNTINYAVYTNKSGQWDFLINITHPQTWTVDENLKDETRYYYKIKAWGNLGFSSGHSSAVSYYLTDITPPEIPSGINISPVLGDDALNISWNLTQYDTVNYNIWWEEPANGSWVELGNVSYPNNHFIFTNESLINGSTYYFKIRGWDKVSLSSAFSSLESGVHRDYLTPNAPSNLNAKTLSKAVMTLSWDASPDMDVIGYRIYMNQSNTSSGGPYKLLASVNTLMHQLTELSENTTYYFVVTAIDEANNPSSFSNIAWNTTYASAKRPRVILTVPANNSINVSIDNPVTILFNIPMVTTSVERLLSISPTVEYNLLWTENYTLLHINFINNLSYDTAYITKLGDAKATTGGILEDAPFILFFKTKMEPIIQSITIKSPLANTEVKPKEVITVFGISSGFTEGTEVKVTLGKIMETCTIDADGNWSTIIKAPDAAGRYLITADLGNKNDSVPITVLEEFEPDDDTTDENGNFKIFGLGSIWGLVLLLLISTIIIIVIIALVLRKKRPGAAEIGQDDEQKYEEGHGQKEFEDEDELLEEEDQERKKEEIHFKAPGDQLGIEIPEDEFGDEEAWESDELIDEEELDKIDIPEADEEWDEVEWGEEE